MVSIVVPVYNVEQYIDSCLQSIAEQSYTDFEVILINDGSSDHTLSIIEAFIANHPDMSVTLIRQNNRGVSAARNNGIRAAKGEFICFVDADDMLDTEYLSLLVSEITANDADIALCRSKVIKEDCSLIQSFQGSYGTTLFSNCDLLSALLRGEVSAGIWALLCRRTVLGDLRFAEGFRYSEDLEMVWRLTAMANKIVRLDAQLYDYRIRPGSAMTIVDSRRLDGMKLFLRLESFMEKTVPEFFPVYKKYGAACWVWSTIWQEALAAASYKEFGKRIEKYSPDSYMEKLLSFDVSKKRITAFLFLYMRYFYYILIKITKHNYRKIG